MYARHRHLLHRRPSLLELRDLQENRIPIFERAGWRSQPALSKIGILLIPSPTQRCPIQPQERREKWLHADGGEQSAPG